MDVLIKLSPSNIDFSGLEAIFGSDTLITIINGDGILLAANQKMTLTSHYVGPETFGKHIDELVEGYCFERMSRRLYSELLRTGVPNMIDRVLPHKQRIIVRVRTLIIRIPWGAGFAVLNVSHEVPDYLVESLRNYNPKNKMLPSTIPGVSMRWVDFETMYLITRYSSTKEIATVLCRSDDAVRLRLQALADYLQKTFARLGYMVTVSPTLKALQPILRQWPINDAVLAGCINGLNARYGDNSVAIAGLDTTRQEESASQYDKPIESPAVRIMRALANVIDRPP